MKNTKLASPAYRKSATRSSQYIEGAAVEFFVAVLAVEHGQNTAIIWLPQQ